MLGSLLLAILTVFAQNDCALAQEAQVPKTLTAAEMWNPVTWWYPFLIASAESYRDYFMKAQQAQNALYEQIQKTNAFPWLTGNWSRPNQNNQGENQGGRQEKTKEKPEQENSNQNNTSTEGTTPQSNPDTGKTEPEKTPQNKPENQKEETNPEKKPGNKDMNTEVQNGDNGAQGNGTADTQIDDGMKKPGEETLQTENSEKD